MATFHPYPARLLDLKGERAVLGSVSMLPSEAHVFVRLGLLDAETNRDRELDFLVLHPDLGPVLIEVKGGRLVNRDGAWHREHQGVLTPLNEPPGTQLNAQQYLLQRWLRDRVGFVPHFTRVLALPHMDWPADRDLDTDLPACRVLDRTRLQNPTPALRRAVAGQDDWTAFLQGPRAAQHRISPALMQELLAALQPAVLPPPQLAEVLKEEGDLQDREAGPLLQHLADNFARGRFHVQGAPGSGKSLVARLTARLWAAEGRRVLFLAYNKALVHATQVALEDLSDADRVHVSTYHDLACNLLFDLGRMPPGPADQDWFDRALPAALAEAAPLSDQRWDALVVDEAQDLLPAWIPTLLALLHHPERDPVLLVEDPAQAIFRAGGHGLGTPWRLDLNLRQHPVLRRAAWEALRDNPWPKPPAVADDAEVLRQFRSSPETWRRDLAEVLQRFADQGLDPGRVLVLAPHRPSTLGLRDGQRLGPWALNTQKDWWAVPGGDQVRFGTVQGFKGLEADAVVYLAPAYPHEQAERLRYTALTRARHRAVVIGKALARPEPRPQAPAPEPAQPGPRPLAAIRAMGDGAKADLLGALRAANRGPRANARREERPLSPEGP